MSFLTGNTYWSQLAARYWVESRRPLAALVFIAPLLLVYELGVSLLGVQAGADVFMRRVLNLLGFGQHLLLPLLTIAILIAWHYLSREPWHLSGNTITTMAVESLLLGILLGLILFVYRRVFCDLGQPLAASLFGKVGAVVGYLGAGIYEELLFRLILLSPAAWLLWRIGLGREIGFWTAALLVGLLFAVAHHLGDAGEKFQPGVFIFRMLAGIYFATLFRFRGFGIAAGSHAAYDILVGIFR